MACFTLLRDAGANLEARTEFFHMAVHHFTMPLMGDAQEYAVASIQSGRGM